MEGAEAAAGKWWRRLRSQDRRLHQLHNQQPRPAWRGEGWLPIGELMRRACLRGACRLPPIARAASAPSIASHHALRRLLLLFLLPWTVRRRSGHHAPAALPRRERESEMAGTGKLHKGMTTRSGGSSPPLNGAPTLGCTWRAREGPTTVCGIALLTPLHSWPWYLARHSVCRGRDAPSSLYKYPSDVILDNGEAP